MPSFYVWGVKGGVWRVLVEGGVWRVWCGGLGVEGEVWRVG